MRILQVIPVFSPVFGGPVTVVRSLSKELAKRHKVTVYTTSALDRRRDSEYEPFKVKFDGYDVVFFPRIFTSTGLNISIAMAEALRENLERYEVVHLHSWRHFQDVIVHHHATKYKVPYVLQVHGSLPKVGIKKGWKWIYDNSFGRRLLRDASKVIALNWFEAEQYRSMGVPEKKIAIIPNGIDLSEYANLPPKGQFKKKFNIPEDKKIVLYLGRIHRIKGIDILVKAYARLTKKMNFKGAVLVIAGPDDGYLSDVKSLVQSLGVSSSVLLTGPLYGRDKLEAYVDTDVYILPSRYETFPMGLLEAYACGKPVIASNVGGLKELMINGETGLSFEAGNVEQLADRLLYLLNHNNETKEMGKKAKGFVQERYSIEKVITKLERLYEEIAVR